MDEIGLRARNENGLEAAEGMAAVTLSYRDCERRLLEPLVVSIGVL